MAETLGFASGSIVLVLVSCASPPTPAPVPTPAAAAAGVRASAPPETSLGVADHGIWSDLDGRLQLALPAALTRDRVEGVISADGDTVVLYVDGWPRKAYPLDAAGALRPGDAAELDGLLDDRNRRRVAAGATPPPADRDRDDIPDPLDVLLGAKKTALEAGAYGGQYIQLAYPGGDVPRATGVCTDVVIRSLRNAGLDLQVEVHEDIREAPRAYPMVKGRGNTSIDHRRVKTILPWFRRHADERSAALDDPADPLRPGDVIFLDTFPDKPGPDHIGVVSDALGESGHPLVINSWTDGYVTQEMDLLGWVPVTHRFRL